MGESFADTKRELYELMQHMRHNRMAFPTPQGMTPTETHIIMTLALLEKRDEPVRPSRVAALSHTTPSALSQTFKTLEEKHLIERHRAQDDCRSVTVKLTRQGELLAEEGRRMRDTHMQEVMAFVGKEDMEHLVRILKRVVEFYESEHADGESASCTYNSGIAESHNPKGGDTACV